MVARPPPHRFPYLLAVFCAALTAVLFFAHTVPAAAERKQLQELLRHREQMLELLRRSRHELAGTELGLAFDPQTLLVEIDKHGLTPDELVERYRPR